MDCAIFHVLGWNSSDLMLGVCRIVQTCSPAKVTLRFLNGVTSLSIDDLELTCC